MAFRMYVDNISTCEEHTIREDSFDININVFEYMYASNRSEHVSISSSPIFQDAFVISCRDFLENPSRFVQSRLSDFLSVIEFQILTSHVVSYGHSMIEYFGVGTSEASHPRMLSLTLDVIPATNREDAELINNWVVEQSMVSSMEKAIASLSKVEVTNQELKAEPCSICLENFEDDKDDVSAMPCDHVYHRNCIVKWLRTSQTCPMCRFSISTE